jgi:predicted nucleic acid-binding protein
MPFVVDASVTACWAFEDEDHPTAALAFDRLATDDALAPGLWWYEVRNLLVMNERRSRRNPADTAAFLRLLSAMPIQLDHAQNEGEVLRIARDHRLTVYDAAYLELAKRASIPLATLDTDLIRAARAESIPRLEA